MKNYMKCPKCKKEFEEKYIDSHHIIPKSIGGTDMDGRIYFCKKCHTILHFFLLKVVWSFVVNKEEAKKSIRQFTEKYKNGK